MFSTAPCVVLAIFTLILIRWFFNYMRIRKILQSIPGPRHYPILGSAWLINKAPREDRLKWLADTCYQFKNGMVLFWIGTEPLLIIRKPHQIETILSSSTLLKKSRAVDVMKPWLGEGLVTSTGKTWQHHRRLITPAFHFGVLEEYASIMRKSIRALNDVIKANYNKNPEGPIDIFGIIGRHTLNTICETAMGVNLNEQQRSNEEYCQALQVVTRLAAERVLQFLMKSDFVYYRTQNGKKFLKAVKTMHEFTEKVILEKQKERAKRKKVNSVEEIEEENVYGKRKPKTFLDLLLDASENDDNPLSLQELREEVDTFMFAGQDTTATGIQNALFALGNAPEIQAKVHEELKEVFGDSNEEATTKQLGQLKYLERVIKEVLRLYPSVPAISRNLVHDTVIDGQLIPKGSIVQINMYQLHRDPDNFPNAEKFEPDNFLPENMNRRHPYSYLPFSAGPRNCIGKKFAYLELKMVLTAILRKWRVTSVLKPSEMKFVANVTLRPVDGKIELYFSPID